MGQTAAQLRQEIEHKRDDAAAKIDRIEAKVQELPNLARDTVRGTVDQSISQVMGTVDESLNQARVAVEEKVEKMKEQADFQGQVEQRPLAALGIAFAGGYLLGKLFGGEKGGGSSDSTDWSQSYASDRASHGGGHESDRMGIGAPSQGYGSSASSQPNAVVSALKKAAHEAGLDNTLSALSGALVATLTDQFNRTIRETFPDFADHLEQQGGLGARGQSGSGSGSGSGSSTAGGSGMGGSSAFGSGSGSGSGTSGSTLGDAGSSPSGSSAGAMGTSSYGQSENRTGA